MTTSARAIRVGDRSLPVILPNRRDARLHTAAVIISIHLVGITALGFRVSVPQILVAIATAGVIDVAMTLRATGKLVWPASGMLTGSGVALILRLVGMDSGNYWSWTGWHWFALVAGVSILTKYLVRYRGAHVFNPSNVGLVVAFIVLGSGVVEPLDFWWAPLGPWMVFAYALIIGGGVLITRRLRLLETAVAFWVVLAAGLGVLAASGHCMTASWSPTPVCGSRFWTVLVTSPEILIFLFFMITDPKTIPTGRAARVGFASTLAVLATLLIAPHSLEYGAKVGLLASLVLWSPLRDMFDRLLPDNSEARHGVGEIVSRLNGWSPRRTFANGMLSGAALVMVGVAIVAAGLPARDAAIAAVEPVTTQASIRVDPATLPEVTIDESVRGLDVTIDDEYADALALTLAENLSTEAEAIRTADGSLLALSSGGNRLDDMQARLDTAIATGERWADEYRFESLELRLHEAEVGQSSAGLVFEATGTVEAVHYDATGAEQDRTATPVRLGFVLRQLAGGRWLIVDTEPSA